MPPKGKGGENMKKDKERNEAFIRSDGWVFSSEGMARLKKGGYKGFARFKENTEAKIGKWHRVLRPLDQDAAAAVKQVRGLVQRAIFLSSAIVKESERRKSAASSGGAKKTVRAKSGDKSEFMRLTLMDEAYRITSQMTNDEFRDLVSEAILLCSNETASARK